MSASHVTASILHSIQKSLLHNHCAIKLHLTLKPCFASAVQKVGYNTATEVPIRASISVNYSGQTSKIY